MFKLDFLKERLPCAFKYVKYTAKWVIISVILGAVCAFCGIIFHCLTEYAAETREKLPYITLFLPFAGLLIVLLYRALKMADDTGTDRVIDAVRTGESVPLRIAPLIIITTALTHLFGGSSGREGAALQIGGSVGCSLGKLFRVNKRDKRVTVMCGMSAVFSAVFGTPLSAAVFALEVTDVGHMRYSAFFPCLLSAIVSHIIVVLFGVTGARFTVSGIPSAGAAVLLEVALLAVLCAILSSIFIALMHAYSHLSQRIFKNPYIRIFVGGAAAVVIAHALGTTDYNGVGMPIIKAAIESGTTRPEAFALKIVLTVLTLASGFKGGEILPSFFIGSTFGAAVAPLLGLDASFAAAIGLTAFFAGVVNCPVAAIIISAEMFGGDGIALFALAAAVSYVISGYRGLYSKQRFVYSKLDITPFDRNNKTR